MPRERIVSPESTGPEEEGFSLSLRPRRLGEVIGQRDLKEKLSIAVQAATARGEPLEHILFHGPPGLGKTTLAHVVAAEMGAGIKTTSGPALTRPADLVGILTNLQKGDVLFIDEVHRLGPVVEEFIYPAMEEFRIDITVDRGSFARTINVPLAPFTMIGATTRAGFLSAPLRERFGIFHHFKFYPQEDLVEIAARSARLLAVEADEASLAEIARRSRGTPRICIRLMRRVRDYAQVRGDGRITTPVAAEALKMEAVDERGLDELDRKFLRVLIDTYGGGPAGIETMAATLNEEVDTLVDMVEPYLLKIGYVARTRQGRTVTAAAYEHLGLKPAAKRGHKGKPTGPAGDPDLFDDA
ncbi:MAG: ATP-dependent DNA helicase RuvB [Planctomycetes bacterium SM23_25]|nr:MAG: ATP-dependent DNA helicase RuvB [Planctomycetes bacterium DG_20]KPK46250.1 MAG: ATP-dependent DNA helicase RuvB [Planctomycetes bacterium SM23_25]